MNQPSTQRRGLGRGLGSLIPTAPPPEQPAPRAEEMGPAHARAALRAPPPQERRRSVAGGASRP